jgi:PAS domain S-box-containing protein
MSASPPPFTPEQGLAHLAAIVESSEDAVVSKTLDGIILSWNPGAEHIYGYTADDVVGQSITLLLPEERRHEEDDILARISRGERVEHFETIRIRKGGEPITVSVRVSPVRDTDGRIIGGSHVARDVSERKRMEESLRHFAAIVEFSEDAIVSKTLEGIILTWNPGAERVYGYSAADAIGKPMTLLLPPDRMEEEAEILRRIGLGNRVEHFETLRQTKHGELIDVSLTISPIRDRTGRIVAASHVARNITERKRLDHQTRHLAAIIESSEDAIISKTLYGTILTWNRGAEKVYGYPAAEAIGRRMTLLLPEDRPNEENDILERIARGERVEHFQTVRRRKSGELIAVSLTISPVRDKAGRILGASHVARNVTEAARIESQLRHFAAIVESSEDAIISKTLDGIILTWNPGAEKIYGYTAQEALGQPMTMLLPPDRINEESEILERINRGERVQHFETVRRTKRGDLIYVSLTISPIRDANGEITGASHVARNITERKQLDEQLRHTAKLESLGLLAGGVAHDFNNLLTGILGNTSLALETLSTNNPARGPLRDALNASERASHLTRQLLAYAGKGRFIIEPINLSGLVREISALVQASIPRNVQLRLELRDDLPYIHADASQLQQLVMNLVINAGEAIAKDESGTVLVTTSTQNVDEHYLLTTLGTSEELPGGTYVSLEVHDTGCGMDEETVARIFDPFFTTKFTGRGLGLAAVQGIVRGHRGAMKVYSRPGKGTTFKVIFPATEERPEPKPALPPPMAGKDEVILVIDDEVIIRQTAKSMLERHGYTVVLAENGREGVELFQLLGDSISAILLDMTMPVMGGQETFSRLKALNSDVQVILSSGYNESEAIRQFTGKGLAGFIQKPYSALALVRKIRSVLQARETNV